MAEELIIERVDRYTIVIDGHQIRSTPEQEARLRSLPQDQLKMFLVAMGYGD